MSQYWTLDTPEQINHFLLDAAKRRAKGQSVCVKYESPESHISTKQFNALHVWCGEVALLLTQCGLDMKAVLKPEVDISWTKDSVKQYLYKPVLEALSGKQSTTEQNTLEPSAVADHIARHLGEKFGITLPPWPDRFNRGQE